MKNARLPRGAELSRILALCGMVGGSLAWGMVELFALQRSRFQAWRGRDHVALASPGMPQARSARRRGRFFD